MEDDVPALSRSENSLRIGQIAAKDLQGLEHRRFERLEPAVIVARVVADEGADVRACTHQPLSEMAADEPGRARDEDRAVFPETGIGSLAHQR